MLKKMLNQLPWVKNWNLPRASNQKLEEFLANMNKEISLERTILFLHLKRLCCFSILHHILYVTFLIEIRVTFVKEKFHFWLDAVCVPNKGNEFLHSTFLYFNVYKFVFGNRIRGSQTQQIDNGVENFQLDSKGITEAEIVFKEIQISFQ